MNGFLDRRVGLSRFFPRRSTTVFSVLERDDDAQVTGSIKLAFLFFTGHKT